MTDPYQYSWDAKDWESRVLQLVRERHGPTNVVRVPDKDRGDLGIEAFTYDGCAYQCYAPDHPSLLAERTKKVKAKIARDILKFLKNKKELEKLFGSTSIRRWILVTPLLDSKEVVLKYEVETNRIQNANLPYVDNDFHVTAADQSDFATEIEVLRRKAALKAKIGLAAATEDDVQNWEEIHTELADSLSGKLRRAYPADQPHSTRRRFDESVKWSIDAGNLLEQLRRDMPDIWDAVQSTTRSAERILETLGTSDDRPREILVQQVDALSAQIKECMPGFQIADTNALVMGTVSDWLMRCPLDFPESEK